VVGPVLTLLVLKTRQPDTLRSFYQALGVDLSEERHGKGPRHFAGRVGETVLEVYPLTEEIAADASTRLGFTVGDVDGVVTALRGVGAPVVSPPQQTTWGYRAVVRDPDGRAIELYQRQ
jgi:lactoylglutathione lyase